MLKLFVAIAFLGIISAPGQSLVDIATSHELRTSSPDVQARLETIKPFVVHIEGMDESPIPKEWIIALVKDKLSRRGTRARHEEQLISLYRDRIFTQNAGSKPLSADEARLATAPKLFVELSFAQNGAKSSVDVKGRLTWLVMTPDEAARTWKTEILAESSFSSENLGGSEVRERIAHALRRELDRLAPKMSERVSRPFIGARSSGTRTVFLAPPPPPTPVYLSAVSRTRFHLGALGGTPALINAHIGLWGIGGSRIATSVSGMYLSRESRGFQWEANWIFDNDGSFEQALGLALVFFNERAEERRDLFDAGMNQIGTEVATVDRLRFYWGPTYSASYRDIRAQLGVSIRGEQSAATPVRLLFQLGFVPSL